MSEVRLFTELKEERLNRWGRIKLSPIERTTAFIIAVTDMHKSIGAMSGIGIEKHGEKYFAVAVRKGMPVRIELDKKMYDDYLSGKPFNRELNYDDYE